MDNEITDLLNRWIATVTPLATAADDASDLAEQTGNWAKADELRADCNEAMASLGLAAMDLLQRIKEERHA